jgi:hypothetical protein
VFAKEPVPSIILTSDIAIYGAYANRLAHAFLFDHRIAADINNDTARHHGKIEMLKLLKTSEGSTTHLHLGTTDLQILQYVELEFVLDSSTDLDNVLEAIIAVHHYEEPIIHILPFKPRAPTTIPTRITKIGGGMKKKPDFGSRDLSAR